MPEPAFQHDRDPLKNLSYYVSRCLVCSEEHRESVNKDAPTAWVGCRCGHVYEVPNRTRWH